MTDDTSDMEDEREIELSSITAIFPEITLDPLDPFSISIELPISPSLPLPVVFPESSEGPNIIRNDPEPHVDLPSTLNINGGHDKNELEIHYLSHLPSVHLRVSLPEGYPRRQPPVFDLSTTLQWISTTVLERLQADGLKLWEDLGHDQVVFAYIDHLQQGAEDAFGVLEGRESLQVSQDLKIALLDFDINAKRAAFEKETFTCGVCLDPKKGRACYRLIDCKHVFCRQCLQDFYNNAINEGDLSSIKCLAPDCAKLRDNIGGFPAGKRRKSKTRISPSELLQIPISPEMVKRYVTLKHKAELQSDKNTIYCPRKWCQGAARSRKHRKPSHLLTDNESSEEESESENETNGSNTSYKSWAERLSVCEDCSFAFCSRCYQGWHGEFTLCAPRTNTGDLTEEDKASLEYLKLHTTPCPTCAAPAQKTHGCNHMICFKCETHFCYLCSAWLEPANPYQHYNLVTTSCYMRLWELEGGDGDDVGIGFAGGAHGHEVGDDEDEDEDEAFVPQAVAHEIQNVILQVPVNPPADPIPPLAEPVAREGPLVLRIGQVPPRVPAPPAPRQGNAHNQNQNRVPGRAQVNHRNGYAERPAGGRHAEMAAHRRHLRAERQARNQRGARNAGPPAAGNAIPQGNRVPAPRAVGQIMAPPQDLENANQRWVENFVRLALADEEDQVEWDSDEEEDAEWQIPVR